MSGDENGTFIMRLEARRRGLYVYTNGGSINRNIGGVTNSEKGQRVIKSISSTEVMGDDAESVEMTKRALMVLEFDISLLRETVERITVQVHALSRRHGIEPTER